MVKNKYFCLLTVIVSLFAGNSANAGTYYLSFNSGASRLKDHCANLATGFTCKDASLAISVDGGYQFNEIFGLELGYGYYGAPLTSGPVSGSTLEVKQSMSGLKMSGTLSLPVTNSFAFFAKMGISDTFLDVRSTVTPGPTIEPYRSNSISPLYGIGMKYSLTRTLTLQAQYENLGQIGDDTTGTDSLSMLSAGITYVFGNTRKSKDSAAPKAQIKPVEKTPQRIAVFLERNVPDSKQILTNAIAQACQCNPVFLGLKNKKTAIYQITLASNDTFSGFRTALLNGDASLGIKVVMLDQ